MSSSSSLPFNNDDIRKNDEPSSSDQPQQQQQQPLLFSSSSQGVENYGSLSSSSSTSISVPITDPQNQNYNNNNNHNNNKNEIGIQNNKKDQNETSDDDDDDDDDDSLLFWNSHQYTVSDFDVAVDVHRGYRATQLRLWSWRRPHMRAFHASWMLYFVNFMLQFSMAPLLLPISQTLQLTKEQVWKTNIWMMVGGIPMRFLLGPLCDRYGARTVMTMVLAVCAIPGTMSWCIVNLTTLTMARIGVGAMDTFVPGQYWITCHFVSDAGVGSTAMAMSGGLGASGSAMAQFALGTFLYPLLLHWTGSMDAAWRLTLAVPSVLAIAVAFYFYRSSDDTPLGNLVDMPGVIVERSAVDSFRRGIFNINSWILSIQYAACCGVDFTMCNGTALYYHARYPQLSVASTAAIAGLYSMAALYARGLGGYLSDTLSASSASATTSIPSAGAATPKRKTSAVNVVLYGSMQRRLWAQLACLVLQGSCNILLARIESLSLPLNLIILVMFSISVQMSMGTCFGIVPYVDGLNTGSVAGVVGAGGNVGAALLALVFIWFDYTTAMEIMGACTMVAALLTPLIVIKGYASLLGSSSTTTTDRSNSKNLEHHQQPARTLLVHARSPHFSTLRQQQQHAAAVAKHHPLQQQQQQQQQYQSKKMAEATTTASMDSTVVDSSSSYTGDESDPNRKLIWGHLRHGASYKKDIALNLYFTRCFD